MALDSQALNDLVPIFQENIDALINNLGKNVILYIRKPNSASFDPINEDGGRRPSLKDGTGEDAQYTLITLKALIKHNPKEYQNFGVKANMPDGILRLKTFLSDVPNLLRCEYLVPNSDVREIVEARYRLVREPIPTGLQVDRYAVSYWERY